MPSDLNRKSSKNILPGVDALNRSTNNVNPNNTSTMSIKENNNNSINLGTIPQFNGLPLLEHQRAMKRTSIFTATLLTKDPNKLLDEIDSLYVNNKKLEEEKSKLVIRVGELETDKKKLEDQIHKLSRINSFSTLV